MILTALRRQGRWFGLTPKKYQSGETNVTGGITLAGDEMVRTALYEAANVLLSRITRFSKLKRWGMDVAKRRGSKRAKVALARKLAVILHRIWVDGTTGVDYGHKQELDGPTLGRLGIIGPITELINVLRLKAARQRSNAPALPLSCGFQGHGGQLGAFVARDFQVSHQDGAQVGLRFFVPRVGLET